MAPVMSTGVSLSSGLKLFVDVLLSSNCILFIIKLKLQTIFSFNLNLTRRDATSYFTSSGTFSISRTNRRIKILFNK